VKFYPLGLDLYKVCQRNQLIWSWNQFFLFFFLMLSWDSVTITDGATTNKYCGTTIPTSISSTTGSLSVNFISDVHTGGAGFEFDYICNSMPTCEDNWPTKKCSKKCNEKKCKKSSSCKKNCKNTCDLCDGEEPCEDQKSSKYCKKALKKGKCKKASVWKKCQKTCDKCD
jgi:hypothetical protein